MKKKLKNKNLIIIGSGGHSRMIIECSIALGYEIKCLIDIKIKSNSKERILGIPVKPKSFLKKIDKNNNIFIAIGDNSIREKFFFKYKRNFNLINLIHPSSYVAENVKIGSANFIGPKAIVNSASNIKSNCIINSGSIIEHECKIMNSVHVGPGSIVCGRVVVEKNCFIGAGSRIIQNIVIKQNSTIGAGSVVLSNTKPNNIYVGSPAKIKLKLN